jgi:hypothetical protein
MKDLFRHLYGAGIIFFYYTKWFIAIGLPFYYFYLGIKRNIILDILWVWCIILIIKDIIYKFVLKKSYCDNGSCSSKPTKEK